MSVCAETDSPAALLLVQPTAGRHLKSGRLQPGVCPHDGLFIWETLLFFGQVFLLVVCTCEYVYTCIHTQRFTTHLHHWTHVFLLTFTDSMN